MNHYLRTTITAAVLAVPVGSLPAANTQPTRQPNIIFILADDLGYGDLGCYGQRKIKTPSLDRLAAEGMRFTQFYAGSTVCAPSRCVLMTGLNSGHCLIRGNASVPLRPQDVTVAEILKGAGYATGLIGKWGLGEAGSTGVPTRQGFDYFFGYLNQVHAHNYYPAFLWRGEQRVPLQNEVPAGKGEFGQGWATKKVEYNTPPVYTKWWFWATAVVATAAVVFLAITPLTPKARGCTAGGPGVIPLNCFGDGRAK